MSFYTLAFKHLLIVMKIVYPRTWRVINTQESRPQ